jgi:hypothetical protein
MLDHALQELKLAFRTRAKPEKWVRDDLHWLDLLDATGFVEDIESGTDRADLFQSAIPYFAFLTIEARAFLLPDYLGTSLKYPHHILSVSSDLDDERGRELLASLTPLELNAMRGFVGALFRLDCARFYQENLSKLENLVQTAEAIQAE